jgi:hypothetical protein
MGDEGSNYYLTNQKKFKITPSAIFALSKSKIPFKKEDEVQKLFLEDLVFNI